MLQTAKKQRIPHYINKLDVTNNIDEALKENLFNTSSYLFEEPQNFLKQKLREPAIYQQQQNNHNKKLHHSSIDNFVRCTFGL